MKNMRRWRGCNAFGIKIFGTLRDVSQHGRELFDNERLNLQYGAVYMRREGPKYVALGAMIDVSIRQIRMSHVP